MQAVLADFPVDINTRRWDHGAVNASNRVKHDNPACGNQTGF